MITPGLLFGPAPPCTDADYSVPPFQFLNVLRSAPEYTYEDYAPQTPVGNAGSLLFVSNGEYQGRCP